MHKRDEKLWPVAVKWATKVQELWRTGEYMLVMEDTNEVHTFDPKKPISIDHKKLIVSVGLPALEYNTLLFCGWEYGQLPSECTVHELKTFLKTIKIYKSEEVKIKY